jgi:hypothetical protein
MPVAPRFAWLLALSLSHAWFPQAFAQEAKASGQASAQGKPAKKPAPRARVRAPGQPAGASGNANTPNANTPNAITPSANAPNANDLKEADSNEKATSPQNASVAPVRPRWLFPDWPASSFQWGGYPVIGFRYVDDGDTRTQTTTLEAGLGVQASGIPLKEGNPGASLAPQAGYALGFVTLVPEGSAKKTGVYHRIWAGFEVPVLVKFSKSTLGLRYAQINGKLVSPSKLGALTFDEGILVLPFFATHYSYELQRVFERTWGDPRLVSQDHWVSLRFFTSVLNARLAFGPAVTFTKFYVDDLNADGTPRSSTSLFADTRTDSLRAVAGSDLFWKVRATLESRYILNVTRKSGGLIDDVGTQSAVRLPDQGVNEAPELPLAPKDSLLTSAFFGIKGLFGGLGFGYRYTVEIFDLNAREGRKTRKRESSGVGLFFDASL